MSLYVYQCVAHDVLVAFSGGTIAASVASSIANNDILCPQIFTTRAGQVYVVQKPTAVQATAPDAIQLNNYISKLVI